MVEIVGTVVVGIGFAPRGLSSQHVAMRTALVRVLTPQALRIDAIAPARDPQHKAR